MAIQDAEWRRLKEQVEVLAGVRGSSGEAAVRRNQLGRVQELLADFDSKAAEIARSIASELSASISALQAKDGTHDTQIKALQDAVKALQDRATALENSAKALRDDLTTTNGTVTANAKVVTDTKAAVKKVTVPALASADVTAAPTAAQYNTLRADVAAMRKALLDIQTAASA